ncbi:aspartate--tRNA ligase [Candidatus Saccharibacteria bacterium]|nr:aspartate--tRNA ligase [Candidatus Saccharibacteria bacterium]
MRTYSEDTTKKVGKTVEVKGWVQNRRDHGGLIFVDLRDHTGIVQLVVQPDDKDAFTQAEHVRDEYVISAEGTVVERSNDLVNPNLKTGKLEIKVNKLSILNKSEPLPIQIDGEGVSSEEVRLKYRFLDLRRSKMQETLKKRADYYKVIRGYMEKNEFTEVTTPILANSSPEGARDFLVPSRLHQGKFYALPQAPQQFKQLLMVGGIHRYYQIATCFRDEDPRADRLYGDFYQLDLEMSFVDDGEQVRNTMEPLILDLVTDFGKKNLLTKNIPRISYQEAMDKYGSDKPDLRFGMELVDLTDDLTNCEFGVFTNAISQGGVVKAIRVEGGSDLSRSQIDKFTDIAKSEGAGGLAYITFQDGEAKSPIAKFLSDSELKIIQTKTNAKDGDIVFFGADTRMVANKVLGRLRSEFADHYNLKDPNIVALAWVVDFPFYEWDDKSQKVDFGHNPFSMPKGGVDAFKDVDNDEKLLQIIADQFDLVMNGYEVCSGAVRNYNPEVMYKAFASIGYDKKHVDEKFGAMINAFKYGAPPHAGCAFGIDRIFMVLLGEHNIREVIAFPKNGSGVDLMMNSPSPVDELQLGELGVELSEAED